MSTFLRQGWNGKRRIALAFVLAVLIVLVVTYRTHNRHPLQEGEVSLDSSPPPSAETLRYGASLAQVHCSRCHGSDLRGMKKDSAGEEVSLRANITSEGRCSTYTAEDFCRAVREGLHRDGSPLNTPMPAIVTRDLSDDDLNAIWTFSQNTPAHNGK
ncbi:MAG: cytochrome c [bacterium]|nr:cytochrome c [bacterium]